MTISRTLFRSGDSEYAINNVPCRLLDIQDLLSDSGVGRQQHVIVSQGQIDAVLNAKAEDRRAIIEEAAGILKYRKRKERSERRLVATEGNLNRLQDLVREVRRQLRPLEKQADAARRHAGVVAELTALRLYIAGRQIDELRTRLETAVTAKTGLTREAEDLKGRLAHLDAEVTRAEAELSARGADDVGDDLVRFESLRERARGLSAVLKERARGIERERLSFTDQGVIFSLEADAATLRRELTDVAAEVDRLTPELSSLAEATSALEADRAAFDLRADDTDTDSDGRAAEARGELVARRGGIERDTSELNRLESRLAELAATAERLDADAEHRRLELERIVEAERPLIDALEEAEHARSRVDHDLSRAEDALRRADAERHRWSARADALELALEDARSRSGADHLSAVDGVLGPLFDAIEVDDGWLPAVEAAIGEALGTVVVADVAAARRAIVALREGEHSGAVLPVALTRPPAEAPSVGEAVRGHVRARRPEVEAVLDALVGAAVAVEGDWTVAADAAEAHPAAVIVTPGRRPVQPERMAGGPPAGRGHQGRARRRSGPGRDRHHRARRRRRGAGLGPAGADRRPGHRSRRGPRDRRARRPAHDGPRGPDPGRRRPPGRGDREGRAHRPSGRGRRPAGPRAGSGDRAGVGSGRAGGRRGRGQGRGAGSCACSGGRSRSGRRTSPPGGPTSRSGRPPCGSVSGWPSSGWARSSPGWPRTPMSGSTPRVVGPRSMPGPPRWNG